MRLKFILVSLLIAAICCYLTGAPASFFVYLTIVSFSVVFASVQSFRKLHARPFYFGFAIVGWAGMALTVFAKFPITETSLLGNIVSKVKVDGDWLDFYGSAFLGVQYLIATCISAVAAGGVLYFIFNQVNKSKRIKENQPVPPEKSIREDR